jgi:hypothetical protein
MVLQGLTAGKTIGTSKIAHDMTAQKRGTSGCGMQQNGLVRLNTDFSLKGITSQEAAPSSAAANLNSKP